ncbi:MAG: hypothetical protein WC006_04460 [Bacilli bacterium]
MKNKKIVIIAILFLVIFALTSCDREREGEKENVGKTQLYIGTFEGGYGEEWLYAAKERFEEKYKDVSFEEGKVGVQVMITSSRQFVGQNLSTTVKDLVQEIFFTEALYYYDFVNNDLMLDISDVVTENLNYDFVKKEFGAGEEKSIEDKMLDPHIDFYKTNEDKYFAIPFYQAFYGIIYDVDLFEEENLYFAAEGYGNSYGFVRSSTDPKSPGPDGLIETEEDNGLPATYEDFFILLDYMYKKNLEPITWGGKVQSYVSHIVRNLWADYEGFEQMSLSYNFDGLATNLIKDFDDDGNPILYSQEINSDNGHLIYSKQAGRYYALSFLEQLINNKNFYKESLTFSPSQSHKAAQDYFLQSKFSQNRKRVGMIMDGIWWMHEAGPTFQAIEKNYGSDGSAQNRKFGILPLPKVDENHLGKQTFLETNFSVGFINANVPEWKQPLAKAFLQFVHTDESLKEFTKITNTFKPYDYKLNEEELNELTYYGRALYNIHQNAEFVSPLTKNPMYLKNVSTFVGVDQIFNTEIMSGGRSKRYNYPSNAMFDEKITAKDYFLGYDNYWTKSLWDYLK